MLKIDIKIDVLKARVTVYVGEQEKFIHHHLDGNGYLARCIHRTAEGRFPHRCIIHSKSAAMSVIAHEAVHAASFILGAMGAIADYDDDEVQAYIVQHICEKVEAKLLAA